MRAGRVMGVFNWVSSEVVWGLRQQILGLYQLIRHPINSLYSFGNAVRHPQNTLNALWAQTKEHPLGMVVNVGSSFALSSAVSRVATMSTAASKVNAVKYANTTLIETGSVAHSGLQQSLTSVVTGSGVFSEAAKGAAQVAQQAGGACSSGVCSVATASTSGVITETVKAAAQVAQQAGGTCSMTGVCSIATASTSSVGGIAPMFGAGNMTLFSGPNMEVHRRHVVQADTVLSAHQSRSSEGARLAK